MADPGAISPDEVRRIAALARISVSDPEAETLARDLAEILQHVEELAAVEDDARSAGDGGAPADSSAPTYRPEPPALRDDEPGADPLAAGPDHFAPDLAAGYFAVPRLASHEDDPGSGTGA